VVQRRRGEPTFVTGSFGFRCRSLRGDLSEMTCNAVARQLRAKEWGSEGLESNNKACNINHLKI
jgi:hypothetical protein